jgi:hypothetical protein
MRLMELVVGRSGRISVASWGDVYRELKNVLVDVPWGMDCAWVVFDDAGIVVACGACDGAMFGALYSDLEAFVMAEAPDDD